MNCAPPDFQPDATCRAASWISTAVHAGRPAPRRPAARRVGGAGRGPIAGPADHLPPSAATRTRGASSCRPGCRDQRNQMTAGRRRRARGQGCSTPGPRVMLDLEDSMRTGCPSSCGRLQHRRGAPRRPDLRGPKRGRRGASRPGPTRHLSRCAPPTLAQAGRDPGGLTRLAVRPRAHRPPGRARAHAAPAVHLHPQVGVGGGGGVVARRLRGVAEARGWPATPSAAWRWSSPIRSPTRWRSSLHPLATTSWLEPGPRTTCEP